MRVYLDHNATAPLRAEARAAMVAAMEVAGNPSSVHGEGRAAKALVETARAQVAEAVGCAPGEVIFTASATEAAALALWQGRAGAEGAGGKDAARFRAAGVEHDAVLGWCTESLGVNAAGQALPIEDAAGSVLQAANSETGVLQELPAGLAFSDMVQAFGKVGVDFAASGARTAAISGHKIGGPKGVGALIVRQGTDIAPLIRGGGQEMGRRSGTENVIGIAGFGAAARAAAQDVVDGRWERVAELRNILENALECHAPETIFVGKEARRLPNTTCVLTPGWKGETQVMQMDLAGFSVSAGSACSSGKVRSSRVLRAMGFDQAAAASAIRVSLGLETTEDDVLRFADAWGEKLKRHKSRAA